MKQYLLFAGLGYYPEGGWYDFQGFYDTVEEAQSVYHKNQQENFGMWDWYHVVDSMTGDFVS